MTFIHDDVFFFPDILIYNNYNSFPVICHIKSCMNIEENFENQVTENKEIKNIIKELQHKLKERERELEKLKLQSDELNLSFDQIKNENKTYFYFY